MNLAQAIHRGLRTDRRRALASILDILQAHPAFVFQIAVFVRMPSLVSAGMIVIGAFVNHFSNNVVFILGAIVKRIGTIVGCIRKLHGRKITRYSPEDFLDKETHADIDEWLVRRPFEILGIRGAKLDQLTKIFVVEGGLSNISCHSIPFLGSFIYLSDPPEETHGIRRFFVLHEIGHAQVNISALDFNRALGWNVPLFFLIWLFFALERSQSATLMAVAIFLGFLIWREKQKQDQLYSHLWEEIVADCFALGYLSEDDLARLANNKRLEMLVDKSMPSIFNMIRLAKLRENLALALKGDHENMIERSYEGLPTEKVTPIAAAVTLNVLPAFYAANPTVPGLLWAAAVAAALLVLHLFLTFLQVAIATYIEQGPDSDFEKGHTSA